jgi:GNAT superfamily N-acetyltransferase
MMRCEQPPSIRVARVEDAAAAAACHAACWREAYAQIVDPVVLAVRTSDLAERTRRWRQRLEAGAHRWLALVPDDVVVGCAARGPGRDDDIDLDCELEAIYVREAYWGSGLADRLLEVTIGDEPAYLWVFEASKRREASTLVMDSSRTARPNTTPSSTGTRSVWSDGKGPHGSGEPAI